MGFSLFSLLGTLHFVLCVCSLICPYSNFPFLFYFFFLCRHQTKLPVSPIYKSLYKFQLQNPTPLLVGLSSLAMELLQILTLLLSVIPSFILPPCANSQPILVKYSPQEQGKNHFPLFFVHCLSQLQQDSHLRSHMGSLVHFTILKKFAPVADHELQVTVLPRKFTRKAMEDANVLPMIRHCHC